MADPRNPYLPSSLDRLSTMLMALGAGVSGAESRGQSGWAGLGPAAAMYGQANQQANQQAMQYGMWQQQQEEQKAYRQAQEENIRSQIDEREGNAARKAKLTEYAYSLAGQGGGTPPGIRPQPTTGMGPGGDYFSITGGAESGGNYKAVNGKGSGAYGKYQFMPDTWASVAPGLGLPFNIRQSTPEQQEMAMRELTKRNAQELGTNNPAVLYLAHRFGTSGAKTVLSSDPSAPIASLFPPTWAQQNPDMQGVTVGQFVQTVQQRFGGASPPNAQGQGDSSGGGSMPPQGGPQMPGPPPNMNRLLPLAMDPDTARLGTAMRQGEQDQYKYNWDTYNATAKQQQFEQEQRMRERSQSATERHQDRTFGLDVKRFEKPPEPGTPAGDVHILSKGDPTAPDYRAAYIREATPKLTASGQLMYPDMSAYRKPEGAEPNPASGARVEDTPSARFTMEGKLADDFNTLKPVKDYREVMPIISSMRDAATRNNRVADLNLIYGLAKIMDPTSVVRESEQIMVRNAQSLPEWVQGMIDAANGGSQFPPAQRQRIMQEAESRANSFKDQYEAIERQFTERAKTYGLNPKNVITAPFAKAKEPASAAPIRIDMRGNSK